MRSHPFSNSWKHYIVKNFYTAKKIEKCDIFSLYRSHFYYCFVLVNTFLRKRLSNHNEIK